LTNVGQRNLARLAEEVMERRGDYRSLCFEGRWHGSAELHERGTRLAARLVELGVAPGDRVLVMAENSPDVPVAYHAISRAGGVITPAIFLLTAEELRRILLDSGAAVVLASPHFRDVVDAAAAGLETVRHVLDLDEAANADADPAAIVPREDDDLAALVYTGGTTGRSKGVALTHANLWEAGRHASDFGHVAGVVRSLTCLPLSHSYGLLVLGVAMHSPEPPESVLMRWFDASSWLELAQEHRTQIAPVVPSMLYLLLAEPLEDYDLSELKFVASGAAPLATDAMAEFERRVPGVAIREGYGLTETSALAATNPPGRIRRGTVGLPVPGTEIRVVDDEDTDVPVGEPGEICIRSDLVMPGYWNDPGLTAVTVRGGWLHTGDIGRLDADGYLTIVDRKKDLILRGGFNVYPRDIEEALIEHPAVNGACVVGRPDAVHGEEVVAFVTLAPGAEASVEDLLAFGKKRLGGYKYPRELTVLPSLPLTPVGKVDRTALRGLLTTVEGGVR
jgi:long-chain acyl-CoA synthetase